MNRRIRAGAGALVLALACAAGHAHDIGSQMERGTTTLKDADTGSFNNVSKRVPSTTSLLLYGKVETGFMMGNSDIGVKNREMWNGTSYWGMRGTEALGGGTTVFFFLEQGFKLLSGKGPSNGVQWSKGSYVGLADPGWGRIELGRMHKPDYWAFVESDRNLDFSDSSLSAIKLQYDTVLGYSTYSDYFSNAIYYASPHLHGFSGDVAYGFSERVGFQSRAGQEFGTRLRWAGGPVKLNVAFNDYGYYATSTTSKSSSWKTEIVSGSARTWHDIEIGANMIHARRDGDGWFASSWQLTVGIPLGNYDLNFGTANVRQSGDKRTQAWSANYAYHLSPRTTLFANAVYYHNNRNGTAAVGVFANDDVRPGYAPWAVGVGMKHRF